MITDASRSEAAITSELTGSVLTVTLRRPDKRNALRQQDTLAILEKVAAIDGNGPVRALLICGDGQNFCNGADLLSDFGGVKPSIGHIARALDAGPHRLIASLWNCPVPTIAAVQGKAAGLGLHLAVVCDFVIAADDAVFLAPFCNIGFSVDSGGSYLLPRLIGMRRARQMLLRGRPVSADTAADWGLIDEVVSPDALIPAAAQLAAELAAGPTFSLKHTKSLLNRRASERLDDALEDEALSVEATTRSADFKEGMHAFVERRQPEFTGR